MILSHYDLRLPAAYTFSASDLAASLRLDEKRVTLILDDHALSWGSLHAYETEHLHLSNPVWKRPLIQMGDRELLLCSAREFFQLRDPLHGNPLVSVFGRGKRPAREVSRDQGRRDRPTTVPRLPIPR